MGDENKTTLQYVVELLAKGEGGKVTAEQIKELIKLQEELKRKGSDNEPTVQQAAEASLKKLNTTKAQATEESRHAKVLDELKRSQAGDTDETNRAVTAKERLREILQGLGVAVPQLGSVMRGTASGWGLLIAGAGAATVALRRYLAGVDEAVNRGRELATVGRDVQPTLVIAENIKASWASLGRSFDAIKEELNSVSAHYDRLNAAMLLNQQLAERIQDAQADAQVEEINAKLAKKLITQGEANQQIENVQRGSRDRKRAGEISAVVEQLGIETSKAASAAFASRNAEEQAQRLEPAVAAQQKMAVQSRADVSKVSEEDKLAEMKQLLALAEQFSQEGGRSDILTTFKAYAAKWKFIGKEAFDISELTTPLASDQTIKGAADKLANQVRSRIQEIMTTVRNLELVAQQEENKAKELAEQFKGKQDEAAANSKIQATANAAAEELLKRLAALKKAKAVIDEALARADASKDVTIKAKADEKAAEEAAEQQKQLETEARNWSKRAAEARLKGQTEPEKPSDLKDRSWTYDATTDSVRFAAKPTTPSAAQPVTAPDEGPAWMQYEVATSSILSQAASKMKELSGKPELQQKWANVFEQMLRDVEAKFIRSERSREQREVQDAVNRARPGPRDGVDAPSGSSGNLAGVMQSVGDDVNQLVELFLDLKRTTSGAVSRAKNDGGRIG